MAKDTILVIDDNRTFCNYLCSILESKGFHTRNAYSFKNAVELVRNAHVEDVVLCDLQLGDNKTGNDLLKWMNDNDIRNPFIIMTQYDQAVTAVEAMKLGAVNYIPKELLFDKLYPQIEEIIRHRELRKKKTENIQERKSKAFQEVYHRVFLCAPIDLADLKDNEPEAAESLMKRLTPDVRQKIITHASEHLYNEELNRVAWDLVCDGLTFSEKEICKLILQGHTLKEICAELNKSESNITSQRCHIRKKLNMDRRDDLRRTLEVRFYDAQKQVKKSEAE